jgi:hypothetical protein
MSVWTIDALDEESNMKIGQSLKELWKITEPISYGSKIPKSRKTWQSVVHSPLDSDDGQLFIFLSIVNLASF